MTVFPTLKAAIDAGFTVYDKLPNGYLMRIKTANGWAMAIVEFKGAQ
ncbi:MAG: hypothetical protein NVS3B3_09250 [Aquirhabdus sp.]